MKRRVRIAKPKSISSIEEAYQKGREEGYAAGIKAGMAMRERLEVRLEAEASGLLDISGAIRDSGLLGMNGFAMERQSVRSDDAGERAAPQPTDRPFADLDRLASVGASLTFDHDAMRRSLPRLRTAEIMRTPDNPSANVDVSANGDHPCPSLFRMYLGGNQHDDEGDMDQEPCPF